MEIQRLEIKVSEVDQESILKAGAGATLLLGRLASMYLVGTLVVLVGDGWEQPALVSESVSLLVKRLGGPELRYLGATAEEVLKSLQAAHPKVTEDTMVTFLRWQIPQED